MYFLSYPKLNTRTNCTFYQGNGYMPCNGYVPCQPEHLSPDLLAERIDGAMPCHNYKGLENHLFMLFKYFPLGFGESPKGCWWSDQENNKENLCSILYFLFIYAWYFDNLTLHGRGYGCSLYILSILKSTIKNIWSLTFKYSTRTYSYQIKFKIWFLDTQCFILEKLIRCIKV